MSKQRNTVQRQIIISTLKKLNTHPTIDEIYTLICKDHPSISKTTVYRNLRQLAADGQVRHISMPDGLERYDGRIDHHYHFMCRQCGAILDVEIDYLTNINDTVQDKYGIQVDNHDVAFSGICTDCKK